MLGCEWKGEKYSEAKYYAKFYFYFLIARMVKAYCFNNDPEECYGLM